MLIRYLLPLLLIAPAWAESTAITPADPQLGRPVDFYQDLFPVLESKCLACHNVKTKEGALLLESIDSLLKGGDSGPAVVAGEPDQSLLYKLASRADEPVMPPLPNNAQAKPLTPRELGLLRQWIQEGAQRGNPPPASALQWRPVPSQIRSIGSLALSPTNRFLAAGRANRVVLIDLIARREIAQLTDPALLSIQFNDAPMYGQGIAHRDLVHAVAFSPDGRWLASSGYREVKLWEQVSDQRLAEWDAGVEVTAFALSPDGARAATGQVDGSIRLWDIATGQPGPTLLGHAGAVRAIVFTTDGAALLTGGDDKTLRRWQLDGPQEAARLATPSEVTALLAGKEGAQAISAHQDGKLRVWDAAAWPAPPQEGAPAAEPPQPLREIGGHGQPVTALAWAPGTDEFLTACRDGNVRLINFADGKQIRAYALGAPVLSVTVTANGERVAAAAESGLARIWNRADGKQLAEIKGNPQLARQVALLTDEAAVAKARVGLRDEDQKQAEKDEKERDESLKKAIEARDAAIKARDEADQKLKDADQKAQDAAKKLEEQPEDAAVKKAKEEADKARTEAAAAQQKAVTALESAERAVKLSTEGLERAKQNAAQAKAAHEAAQTYAKECDERLTKAKEAAGQSPGACRCVSFGPEGLQVVTGGDGNRLDLWDGTAGAALETLAVDQPVRFAAFTSNGSLAVVDGNRLTIRDVRPQWKLAARLGPPADSPLEIAQSPFADRVLALAFSPDGTRLLTGGGEPSRSGELLLWDVATRTLVRPFTDAHSDTVFDVEFSRDGRYIVSGAADKFVKLFEVETGKLVRSYEGHTNHVLAVSIKADGSSLASGGADNAIKIWNLETGEQRRTINNFQKQVTALDYIGVSDNLVGCGGDKTVRLFTASNGNNFRTFGGMPDFVYDAVATPDQGLVIAGGEDGVIRVWNGQNGNEVTKFEPPAAGSETANAR